MQSMNEKHFLNLYKFATYWGVTNLESYMESYLAVTLTTETANSLDTQLIIRSNVLSAVNTVCAVPIHIINVIFRLKLNSNSKHGYKGVSIPVKLQ